MLTVAEIHTYYGKSHVLHGVSLELRPGEVVALLGRNGVGKTTTLKSILGLEPPRQGRVELDGRPLTTLAAYRIGRLPLGYVPQGRRIFPELTVEENLRIGVTQGRATGDALDRVYRYFPVVRERSHQLGGTLSGGEQQMLAIARALVKAPAMLLMDEPSEGLSPLMIQKVAEAILALHGEGLGILLAEQQVGMALDLATRVYIMVNGAIVYTGQPDELRRNEELMRRHLGVVV
jgi:branched-chain amino acid transport system ATP-binding protein